MAGVRGRSWLHTVCFSQILSISVDVILDLEYPWLGLIRVNTFDPFVADVRSWMK